MKKDISLSILFVSGLAMCFLASEDYSELNIYLFIISFAVFLTSGLAFVHFRNKK